MSSTQDERLERALRNVAWATTAIVVVLGVLLVVGSYFIVAGRNDTHRLAVENSKALCALRADVRLRVKRGDDFLRDHPNGIDGISAATFRQSLAGPRHTAKILAFLRCPAEK